MLKVSVCITTFNLESYIYQTLDSVLMQDSSFEYEIIVADDGSNDRTREILLEYKKLYPDKIILHFQKENVGVNRNDYDLIHLAQGEYIAWCDGDDYWLTKDKLQKQVDVLDNNPSFSCVHTHWVDSYELDGRKQNVTINQKTWESELKGDKYVEHFIAGETSGCRFSSLMCRKSLLLDFLYKDSSILLTVPHKHNDFAIFCILAFYGPFFLLPEYTTAYRIREVSLSMGNDAEKRINYTLAYLQLLAYLYSAFDIRMEVLYKAIRRNVASVLHVMYVNRTNDWTIKICELTKSVSATGYRYSLGQKMLILTIKNKIIYSLTHRLFDYLYTRSLTCNSSK